MTKISQLFLQSILQLKTLSEIEMKLLFSKCHLNLNKQEPTQDGAFEDFMAIVNQTLFPISLQIAKHHNPSTGALTYALINTINDHEAQLATNLSLNELGFFKVILDKICNSSGFVCGRMELSNSASDINMTKRERESFINRCIDEAWLSKDPDVSFGPRTLLELGNYIKEEFGELPECKICGDIATVYVEHCTACDTVLHLYCRKRLFPNSTVSKKCPDCKADWITGSANKPRPRKIAIVSHEEEEADGRQQDESDTEEAQVNKKRKSHNSDTPKDM